MKLLNETYKPVKICLEEGVADKYAAEKHGIQDPEAEFEKKFQQHKASQVGEVIGEVSPEHGFGFTGSETLIKNPKDLKNFPPGSRGIITRSGDLYLIPDAEGVIHQDILRFLKKKGIIKSEIKD